MAPSVTALALRCALAKIAEMTCGKVPSSLTTVAKVTAGEPIVVIGTPKLNLEVEAPVAGTLGSQLVAVDDIVEVGAPLVEIA